MTDTDFVEGSGNTLKKLLADLEKAEAGHEITLEDYYYNDAVQAIKPKDIPAIKREIGKTWRSLKNYVNKTGTSKVPVEIMKYAAPKVRADQNPLTRGAVT